MTVSEEFTTRNRDKEDKEMKLQKTNNKIQIKNNNRNSKFQTGISREFFI